MESADHELKPLKIIFLPLSLFSQVFCHSDAKLINKPSRLALSLAKTGGKESSEVPFKNSTKC